ncbi:HNH endonuclease [Streptomyces sp. NPDC086838]|uniref:HNH endonuclease n=1 Tax=Streptomyces sp. NPDC086838 TaxID=3365762 RepID=UPI0038296E08
MTCPAKHRNKKGRGSSRRRRYLRGCVAARDGHRCHYCHTPLAPDLSDATLDHYIPWSLWRANDLANLVLACHPCNETKGAALPWTVAYLLLAHAQAAPPTRPVTVPEPEPKGVSNEQPAA